jgi:hypothetical protein
VFAVASQFVVFAREDRHDETLGGYNEDSLVPQANPAAKSTPRIFPTPYGPKMENASSEAGDNHASSGRTNVIVQHPTEPFAAANSARRLRN